MLEKMYSYVETPFVFFDEVSKKFVTEETSAMKIVERRMLKLKAPCNLLDRLEGSRRSLVLHIRLLSDKIFILCKFYNHISALEDLSACLGALVDVLMATKDVGFLRAAAIELCLPSMLGLLDLIVNKRIKTR